MQNKTDDRQLEYSKKYLSQFEDIKIRVVSGERQILKDYATDHGWKSLNHCIVSVMDYIIANGLTADDFKLR